MGNRKIISTILTLGIFIAGVVGFLIHGKSDQEKLTVDFFDVGQGDAILISLGDRQMLIDGGRDGRMLLEKLGRAIPFWDRTIEVVVATHPDQDHIGGLASVLDRYQVPTIVTSPVQSQSKVATNFFDKANQEKNQLITAQIGQTITLADQVKIEVLFPIGKINQSSVDESTNAASVVLKLTFGDHSFLFTGDLPAEQEQQLMATNYNIQSEVLKVAHHGSKYSTSNEFLEVVQPQEAVVSVGAHNSYGHPSEEVLTRLRNQGIHWWRTDQQGDILFECLRDQSRCAITTSK